MQEVVNKRGGLVYLGPQGTITEEAAAGFAAKIGIDQRLLIPANNLAAVLETAESGEARWAVVPAENSLEGSVNLTWDWLLFEGRLVIAGEEVRLVRHHLLGQRGAKPSEITTVLSHPQALAQCRGYLRRALPNAKQYETVSTAEAARVVSVNQLPLAAIGTESAARIYGLDLIASDIQDVRENFTRFLLLTLPESGDRPWILDPSGTTLGSTATTPHSVWQPVAVRPRRL